MKRVLPILLTVCLLLGGCASEPAAPKQYTATFLTLFDTVTTIVGPGETEEAFQAKAQKIHDDLLYYHQLFDIYQTYEGINNLKTLNDQAHVAPVTVDSAIMELLLDCKEYHDLTGGKVNVAMGSVLSLWHEARTDGLRDPRTAKLPNRDKLTAAAEHTGIDDVILDPEASTVYFADPDLRLDVGAVAKGWATQRVAEQAPSGLLISVGGNVCATGPKNGNTSWVIGIQNPEGEGNLHTLYLERGTVVTSGDYQRTYWVEGKQYHHIIDPATQMPSSYWRSVSVICEDSGLADALSTALFLLPLEEGQALAEQCGVEVLWVDASKQEYSTPGLGALIRT
jgi:thiamine biosynthesis lipoprotein